MIKSILLAGIAVAGLGGIAAADPPCNPDQGSYDPSASYDSGYSGYSDYDRSTDEGYAQPAPVYTQPAPVYSEPAAGTYQNGYVWVAGAYTYPNGVAIWMPGHWQRAQANIEPAYGYQRPMPVVVRAREGRWGRGRTARSYRWRSRW